MKNIVFILLLLCQVIFFSCKRINDDASAPNEHAAAFIRQLNTSDTFRYEFPFYYNRRNKAMDSSAYFYIKNSEKWLGLQSIQKGVDSIQIRFSYGCSLMSEWMMIILRNENKKWEAEVLRIESHYSTEKQAYDTMTSEMRSDKPQSGWKKFIDKFFDLKVLSIRDDKVVVAKDDRMPVADGCGIGIEIATKNVYRFYSYPDPAASPEKYWESANIDAIKKLLLEEFKELKHMDKEMNDDWHNMIKQNEEKRAQNEKNLVRKVKLVELTIQDVVDTSSTKKKGRN